MRDQSKRKIDSGEWELPETAFIRDIEDRVFQGIAVQCLKSIDGVYLTGHNFIDNIFGKEGRESLRGVHVVQENKKHSVSVKIEVNILYGIPIPDKAEEIQSKIARLITQQTGLHVSCVHVVFRNVLAPSLEGSPDSPQRFIEVKK